MNQLPDTPRWSPFRRGMAYVAILVGIAMIARGSAMEADMASVADTLVREGASLIGWVFAFIIIGAGSERAAMWLPLLLGKKGAQ